MTRGGGMWRACAAPDLAEGELSAEYYDGSEWHPLIIILSSGSLLCRMKPSQAEACPDSVSWQVKQAGTTIGEGSLYVS